jgi:hypothetical protein
VGAAGAVWEVIDADSSVVAAAYREEESRRHDSSSRETEALLTALLEGQGQDSRSSRLPLTDSAFPSLDPSRASSSSALRTHRTSFTSARIQPHRYLAGLPKITGT